MYIIGYIGEREESEGRGIICYLVSLFATLMKDSRHAMCLLGENSSKNFHLGS